VTDGQPTLPAVEHWNRMANGGCLAISRHSILLPLRAEPDVRAGEVFPRNLPTLSYGFSRMRTVRLDIAGAKPCLCCSRRIIKLQE